MYHFASHQVIEAPPVTTRVHIATDRKRDEKGFIPLFDENPRGRHRTFLSKLLAVPTCNDDDIIPVGSQGILHESKTLAEDSNLRFTLGRDLQLDPRKSAGPATVVLCACPQSSVGKLSRSVEKPINLVGTLD